MGLSIVTSQMSMSVREICTAVLKCVSTWRVPTSVSVGLATSWRRIFSHVKVSVWLWLYVAVLLGITDHTSTQREEGGGGGGGNM